MQQNYSSVIMFFMNVVYVLLKNKYVIRKICLNISIITYNYNYNIIFSNDTRLYRYTLTYEHHYKSVLFLVWKNKYFYYVFY